MQSGSERNKSISAARAAFPAVYTKGWGELSAEEQAAAVQLYYDHIEREWEGACGYVVDAAVGNVSWKEEVLKTLAARDAAVAVDVTAVAATATGAAAAEAVRDPYHWEEEEWRELSAEEHAAYSTLGWDEEMWDNAHKAYYMRSHRADVDTVRPAVYTKAWRGLSVQEQAAMLDLHSSVRPLQPRIFITLAYWY